jgi:hypothetical protein
MRMINPLFKDELKIFSVFFSPVGVSRSPPYNKVVGWSRLDKSGSGLACVTQSQGTQISCVPLDISDTLCPSRVWPARQVIFHVFRPEKRIPAGKTYHSEFCASGAIIIILFAGNSFGKRESVRPSKHCRYDVPTARKFHPTFDDEKDENEEYH